MEDTENETLWTLGLTEIEEDFFTEDAADTFFLMAPEAVDDMSADYQEGLGCSKSAADYLAYVFAEAANGKLTSGYWGSHES